VVFPYSWSCIESELINHIGQLYLCEEINCIADKWSNCLCQNLCTVPPFNVSVPHQVFSGITRGDLNSSLCRNTECYLAWIVVFWVLEKFVVLDI
jgi:hypothetical protein